MDALILSCGTGGGHNTAAYAIKEELFRRGEHVVMINPYLLHSQNLASRIDRAYISVVQNMPACFGVIYNLGEAYRKLPCKSPIYYLNAKMVPIMENYLNSNHFDVVIMTHLFPAEIMTQMKNRGMRIPKTILIATDYTCIPFTEDTDCDAYIIPAEELRHEFQSRGIPRDKIFPLGIPVRAEFTMQVSKKEARKLLGLEVDKKYLLISGGSIGAGKLKKTIRFLCGQCNDNIRIIAICGNNKRLYNSLSKKYGDVVEIIQSTERMAVYLRAGDLYFSKPGGLSSTEAAVIGVPLVHLPPIPGCESKNVHFFCSHGMSYKTDATRRNILQALTLMTATAKCSEMVQNQQRMIQRDSTSNICDFAERLIDKAHEHEGDTMNEYTASERENRLITIPNILSVCRIVMIPVFIWAYCFRGKYYLAFGILCLSGITDLADGFIARTFHMVSNLGKALDPIADKLTQGAVLLCLGIRFPQMFFLAGLLAAKEITTGLMSLSAIHKTKEVKSADWHGKITTCLLYFTMLLHILWDDIPQTASVFLTVVCVIVMAVSFVMYFRRNIALLRSGASPDHGGNT